MKMMRSLTDLRPRTEDGNDIFGQFAVYYDGTPNTEFRIFEDFIERVAPGAFDDVLSGDVTGLFNHDRNNLLGRTPDTLRLEDHPSGPLYRIAGDDDSPLHQQVRSNLRRKELRGSSFGFTVTRRGIEFERRDDGTEVVTITRVERLFDVGPVTFPAYTATQAELRSHWAPLVRSSTMEAQMQRHLRNSERLKAELGLT